MTLLVESSLALILFWGGRQIIGGALSVGTLVAFNALMLDTLRQVRMLGMWVSGVQRTIAAGDRIFEILDTQADVSDKPDAKPLPPVKGAVTFEDVSFAYDGENMVLEEINFSVKPGETIAILGGTGSGKSTLINLIPRFYDVTKGRVLVDGHDIRDVTLESLRRNIGVVTQETFLFSASLRDNIAYGKPEATEEEIRRAAKAAHIDDFIDSLPNGYDTVIGERGVGLSGGQKQRVAIARALLMDARILLLDESTSSVDVETEMQIQKAFTELLKDRTSFIIAQRLSTVRNADRIIVLDKGRIVEEGTHESLLKKGGIYTAIYDLQFRSQEKEEFERQVAVAEGGER
jgi:ATP-binding cassette subfamily B protein